MTRLLKSLDPTSQPAIALACAQREAAEAHHLGFPLFPLKIDNGSYCNTPRTPPIARYSKRFCGGKARSNCNSEAFLASYQHPEDRGRHQRATCFSSAPHSYGTCTDLKLVCYNSSQSIDRCSASRLACGRFLAVFHTVHLLSISYRKLVIFGGTD